MSLLNTSFARWCRLNFLRLTGRRPYRRGLFPLSGDPTHYGHVATIEQALKLCDEVVVILFVNSEKKPTFDLEVRLAQAECACAGIVERGRFYITTSKGVMADEFLRYGCDVLIRGVRDEQDARYERAYVACQRDFFPWFKDVKVEILQARGAYRTISSSALKGAVKCFVAVDRFVPVSTQQRLQEMLVRQYLLGVTGPIASGKSTLLEALKNSFTARGIKAYTVSIDELVRQFYGERSESADRVRAALCRRFKREVLQPDGSDVDRAYLRLCLFGSPRADQERRFVEQLTLPHIRRLYREKLQKIRELDQPNVRQLVFIEWAQPVSLGLARWSNNNVVVVDAPPAEQLAGAARRGISEERLKETLQQQGSAQIMATELQERVIKDRSGTVVVHPNRWFSSDTVRTEDVVRLVDKIIAIFPGV